MALRNADRVRGGERANGSEELPERIGLLGGTFDPPHDGHLAAALHCVEELDLNRLLLMVANYPWQKAPQRVISPAEDRFAMVQAAVNGLDHIEASRLEIDRGGPSYTVETVEALRVAAAQKAQPAPDVFLVIGADLVPDLPTWKRVDDLRRLVTLAVVSRPRSPSPPDPPGWHVVHIDGVAVDVSSSQVRALLAAGQSVGELVPDDVVRCIRRRGLYAVT